MTMAPFRGGFGNGPGGQMQFAPANSLRSPVQTIAPPDGIRTAIFNVKFSPNLGDGVIAECMEYGLMQAAPQIRAQHIDLAGREMHDPRNGNNRKNLIGIIQAMPAAIRGILVPVVLSLIVRLRLAGKWEEKASGCQVAVFGGGAILADNDQNFPIKLSAALDICWRRQIPVAVSHVGVSNEWSLAGKRRLQQALAKADVFSFSVRDTLSKENWQRQLNAQNSLGPVFARPPIRPDPGILASEVFGLPTGFQRRDSIGICLTSPEILRLHGARHADSFGGNWITRFIEAMLDQGHRLTAFTNGSPEDDLFLRKVRARLGPREGLDFAERFTTPAELAHFIASLKGVIAHRLHACIVGHSYGLPVVGIVWDPKIESFLESVGRAGYILDPVRQRPDAAGYQATKALGEMPDPQALAELKEECRAGIAELAQLITQQAASR